jgi:fused signal recognition particle receptor
MDNLPIVLVVVAVVAVLAYVLFFRKKALPEDTTPASKTEPKASQAPRTKEATGAAPPSKPHKPPPPESLPSAVVIADESQPLPIEEAVASVPPPVVSKKDVAGLRKGLAATRGGFMARLKALFTGKKEIDPAIL